MTTPITGGPIIVERDAEAVRQHNLGLRHMEVVAVGVVLSLLGTPPVTPADGDRYIVIATAVNEWSGQEDKIAFYVEPLNIWMFIIPALGYRVWNDAGSVELVWDGSVWA